MGLSDRVGSGIARYSKVVIVVLLVVSLGIGAGATMLSQSSSLSSFQSNGTDEAQAQSYVTENFSAGSANTSSTQIIVRDDNTLSKQSLLQQLALQQALRNNRTINRSLVENRSTTGIANVLATAAISQKRGAALAHRGRALQNRSQQLNAGVRRLIAAINASRAIQSNASALNTSFANGEIGYRNYSRQMAMLDARSAALRKNATANLTPEQAANATALLNRSRGLTRTFAGLNRSIAAGMVNDSTYRNRSSQIDAGFKQLESAAEAQLPGGSPAQGANASNSSAGHNRSANNASTGRAAAASQLLGAVNRTRRLQSNYSALNRSLAYGQIDQQAYESNASKVRKGLNATTTRLTGPLGPKRSAQVETLLGRVRSLQRKQDRLDALHAAEGIDKSTYRTRAKKLGNATKKLYQGVRGVFAGSSADLERRAQSIQENRSALQNRTSYPLSTEHDALESMNASTIDSAIHLVLGANASNASSGGESTQVFAFMPRGYDAGSTSANATMILATHATGSSGGGGGMGGTASDQLTNAELAIQDVAGDTLDGNANALVFGSGLLSNEISNSLTDSLLIVGPLAVVFVLVVLIIAYRDLIDILLGLLGIGFVLLWTFGFMGWAGIAFNQIFIVVPVLLIGLSIDYAIHVFMRHREAREHTEGVSRSMTDALGSVGVALVLVTATAVIGFLSNLVSSLGPIQEFGIVSSVGIVAALVVFGAFMPALKVEIDGFLEAHGWNREKRAFGTGGGALGRVLAGGATAARKAPWIVIALALLLTVAGGVGASQVGTSFNQEDFLADSPPAWTHDLPQPFAPSHYTAKHSLEYIDDHFLRQGSSADVLIRGDVASADALSRVQRGVENASNANSVAVLSNGQPDVTTPLAVMHTVASTNESFNTTFVAADTDGDGVPDRNVGTVYDALFAAAPQQAAGVIQRTDSGEYQALDLSISVKGKASGDQVTSDMRGVAATIEGGGVRAIATGQPVVFKIVQDQLLTSVIESLLITLVATFVFLMLLYRWLHGSATLGFITLLPVGFSVAWILGTMYLLGIPFNIVTGLITSLTVGLGIAYSIHLSERFIHELGRSGDVWDAMYATVTGTGGALLGSAATTVGGFGVLAFAILPPLQQFGIITGLTIIYAFLGSVLVLPSFLALWTQYIGPSGGIDAPQQAPSEEGGTPATDD